MKWGTLYGAEYVNRLYSMVSKNLTYDFKMVCFTDDETGIRDEVQCYPIPEINLDSNLPERMWKKLTTLKKDLYGLEGRAFFIPVSWFGPAPNIIIFFCIAISPYHFFQIRPIPAVFQPLRVL